MPGSIRVSVLEAFDLPETIADGEDVAIKVAVGTREYLTVPSKAVGGKTAPWSVDFIFPVLNLRDNLLVILLDKNGDAISKSEIDTSSIVERGSFDVNLLLNGGGNVYLSLSFVLTEEERRRIDVMRAAALKRREQEALKLSARTQLVPVAPEQHSTPAGSLEKDIEKAGGPKDSLATASQDADVSRSEPVSQATSEDSLICAEPTGKLGDKNSEEPQPNIGGAVEEAAGPFTTDCVSKSDDFTSLDSGNQECTGIAGSVMFDNRSQAATNTLAGTNFDLFNPSTTKELNSEDHMDLDTSDISQLGSEDNKELVEDLSDTNLKPTSSGVKAKIKAFEKTRPQGASKQNHILSPSSKIQKSSPHGKMSSRKKVEGEAEQVTKVDEACPDLQARIIENEPTEPAKQLEASESDQNVLMADATSLETPEEGHMSEREKCLFEKPSKRCDDEGLENVSSKDNVRSNGRNFEAKKNSTAAQKGSVSVGPATRVDTTGIRDGNLEYQTIKAEHPKYDETKSSPMQESKKINLVGLSKQVLSGAVLIAAGALLWAANSKRDLSKESGSRMKCLKTFSSLDPRASASSAGD